MALERKKETQTTKVEGPEKEPGKGPAKPEAEKAKPKAAKPKPKAAKAKPKSTEKKPKPATKPMATAPKVVPSAVPEARAKPPVVKARATFIRSSARKVRLVADHIRGKSVVEAKSILEFSNRACSKELTNVLNSGVANAENNHELIGDELKVLSLTVDEGPTLKRYRPRARGRATPIHKRTCHISIELTPIATLPLKATPPTRGKKG